MCEKGGVKPERVSSDDYAKLQAVLTLKDIKTYDLYKNII